MPASIQKPAIPARRVPIPVSEQARNQARAGMSGEQVRPAPESLKVSTDEPVATVSQTSIIAAKTQSTAPIATLDKSDTVPPIAVLMEPEHSVKIPESVWNEIRMTLLLLPRGGDSPANIKAYLVAAHRFFDAQLREQGKLPATK